MTQMKVLSLGSEVVLVEEVSNEKPEKQADTLMGSLKRDRLETMNYPVFCKFYKLGCIFHHKNTRVEN